MKVAGSEGVKPCTAREREILPSNSRASLHADPVYVFCLTGFLNCPDRSDGACAPRLSPAQPCLVTNLLKEATFFSALRHPWLCSRR